MKLTKQKIVELLENSDNQDDLFHRADLIRKKNVGDSVFLRGLIEFSNFCRNSCFYCGIRRENAQIKRYRLTPDEIISLARGAVQLGFKTIVLQSGEDVGYSCDDLYRVIEEIKKMDVALTLSIGEREYEEYAAFRNCGADRYLMRIETTDKKLYHQLHPKMSWQHRYECLMMIKELGYELGSGILVGLPNQSLESIADDLLFLQKIGIDMAGIGPFIAHPNTPLKNCLSGTLDLSLRAMSVIRLLMPDINIPATTAMETLEKKGRIRALKAGANVVMPNVTDSLHRSFYELYPNKACLNDGVAHCYACLKLQIQSIGRKIGTGYGSHVKNSVKK